MSCVTCNCMYGLHVNPPVVILLQIFSLDCGDPSLLSIIAYIFVPSHRYP